jgi:hypothetical protein
MSLMPREESMCRYCAAWEKYWHNLNPKDQQNEQEQMDAYADEMGGQV